MRGAQLTWQQVTRAESVHPQAMQEAGAPTFRIRSRREENQGYSRSSDLGYDLWWTKDTSSSSILASDYLISLSY